MEWRLLILILVMVPGVMLTKRDHLISDRRVLDYDVNDPTQVMKALNSLPSAENEKLDMDEYLREERARIDKAKAEYLIRFNAQKSRKSLILPRRAHNHDNPNEFLKELNSVPNLEDVVPAAVLKKAREKFRSVQDKPPEKSKKRNKAKKKSGPSVQYARMGSTSLSRKAIADLKPRRSHNLEDPYHFLKELDGVPNLEDMVPNKALKMNSGRFRSSRYKTLKKNIKNNKAKKGSGPKMQYATMGSMVLSRKAIADLKRRYFFDLPVLNKKQQEHVGNNLFYLDDKRLLAAHSFPKKEKERAVYGNLESLALKILPDTREIEMVKRKKRKRVPDANSQPSDLYNKNHPGLSLLFEKDMMLDAAKFNKAKKYLVYGNLENLGAKDDDLNRYQFSTFRRWNNPNAGSFLRSHTFLRDVEESNEGETDEIMENKPLTSTDEIIETVPFDQMKTEQKSQKSKKKLNGDEKNADRLVYGSLDNYGIRYGNEPYRLQYSDFRKDNRKKRVLKHGKVLNSRNYWYRHPLNDDDVECKSSEYHARYPVLVPMERDGYKVKKKAHRPLKKFLRNDEENDEIETEETSAKKPLLSPEVEIEDISHEKKNTEQKLQKLKTSGDEKKLDRLVYGSMDNVGIRYGNESYRTIYSDFRKGNKKIDLLSQRNLNSKRLNENNVISLLLQLLRNKNSRKPYKKQARYPVMVAIGPADFQVKGKKYQALKKYLDDDVSENENDALEIDESESGSQENLRRATLNEYEKNNDNDMCDNDDRSSKDETSDSGDKNPGNPYTIFKSKYKQNYLWNHKLDGNHININPYGPKFDSLGPSGPELFFGRKWWYFNQDDYKTFRRR